ncbi:peptidase S16 [Chitinophaga parva]|uniref:Peptidase S16 n=1 Tax=Chitinophaga parva TaxID=2169414 RepID=A0A2T7BM59_9BACT|nr:LON peptidase substrate-binding domain-containing protein [Chitinophaga parva]PUZ28765.1 peptidase S16 [Chitinophaga parva]
MTNFIPIFPLNVVVYPDEQLNLHVFEPRYKQLIQEATAEKRAFGIPSVLQKNVLEYGTLVEVVRIDKIYDSGEMDVVTKGLQVFRILETIRQVPDKLYSGAIVNYPANDMKTNERLRLEVVDQVKALHGLLRVEKKFTKADADLSAYDLAHHSGLSLDEEYELLHLFHEMQRLEYLKRHLYKVLPVMAEMEKLKERVQLNGHFRKLSID